MGKKILFAVVSTTQEKAARVVNQRNALEFLAVLEGSPLSWEAGEGMYKKVEDAFKIDYTPSAGGLPFVAWLLRMLKAYNQSCALIVYDDLSAAYLSVAGEYTTIQGRWQEVRVSGQYEAWTRLDGRTYAVV